MRKSLIFKISLNLTALLGLFIFKPAPSWAFVEVVNGTTKTLYALPLPLTQLPNVTAVAATSTQPADWTASTESHCYTASEERQALDAIARVPITMSTSAGCANMASTLLNVNLSTYGITISSAERALLTELSRGIIDPLKNPMRAFNPYWDSSGSVYSCTRVRLNKIYNSHPLQAVEEAALVANLHTRIKSVSSTASVITTLKSNALNCGTNMFYVWARDGYMFSNAYDGISGSPTADQSRLIEGQAQNPAQVEKTRMFNFSGISSAFFRSLDFQNTAKSHLVGTSSNKFVTISNWMIAISNRSVLKIDQLIAQDANPSLNCFSLAPNTSCKYLSRVNTQLWRAYSILPTGLLTRNEALVSKARQVYNSFVEQEIAPSNITTYNAGYYYDPNRKFHPGVLVHELKRKSKASHYMAYSAYPLVGMAMISKAYGCDFNFTSYRGNKMTSFMKAAVHTQDYDQSFIGQKAMTDRYVPAPAAQTPGGTKAGALVSFIGLSNASQATDIRSYLTSQYLNAANLPSTPGNYNRLGGSLIDLWNYVSPLQSQAFYSGVLVNGVQPAEPAMCNYKSVNY